MIPNVSPSRTFRFISYRHTCLQTIRLICRDSYTKANHYTISGRNMYIHQSTIKTFIKSIFHAQNIAWTKNQANPDVFVDAYVECAHLNLAVRPEGSWWGTTVSMELEINKQLSQNPRAADKVRTLGYEHFKCLCGGMHPFEACYTLNPSVRPGNWELKRSIATAINRRLGMNPILRDNVLVSRYNVWGP